MARKATSPGKPAPTSGQYRPVGGGNEVTVPKGHRLPPLAQARSEVGERRSDEEQERPRLSLCRRDGCRTVSAGRPSA